MLQEKPVNNYDPEELFADELVCKLIRAVAEAGISNSGLVIKLCGDIDFLRNLIYWKGVTLARLSCQVPAFTTGQKVVPKKGWGEICRYDLQNYFQSKDIIDRSNDAITEISCIWFVNGTWLIQFWGMSREFFFRPADFECR